MFGFTRREQQFILMLLVALAAGLVVNSARNRVMSKPDVNWQLQKKQIVREFQEKSRSEATVEPQSDIDTENHKRALTGQININAADSRELQLLNRIGPMTAQKIIDYRNENGPFKRPEDLKKIKGIGPVTFDNIKSQICIK
ncbi:MAG: ComEA family DNA-binding protein [candidate division KSB1 bacterium]|nr:ComEA family DNA-binding protein [candidate division KSB1 bacterium]